MSRARPWQEVGAPILAELMLQRAYITRGFFFWFSVLPNEHMGEKDRGTTRRSHERPWAEWGIAPKLGVASWVCIPSQNILSPFL